MAVEDTAADVALAVHDIVAAWNAGEIARGTRTAMLITLLTDETIEPVLAALPEPIRSELVSELQAFTSDDPDSYLSIESWCGTEDGWKAHHERTRRRFGEVTLPAIRRWLTKSEREP